MSVSAIILLVVLLLVLFYGITIYNGLVALKHNVAKSFANIEVLLKQRHDELPKLVDTCRTYMQYEQETLNKVIEARSQVSNAQQSGDVTQLGVAEGLLRGGLGRLFALAENYPELKADQTFIHLQQRITSLENSIADRREIYNEWVNNNNMRIEQFPDLLIAGPFGFKPFTLLEFAVEEKADVSIAQLFK